MYFNSPYRVKTLSDPSVLKTSRERSLHKEAAGVESYLLCSDRGYPGNGLAVVTVMMDS